VHNYFGGKDFATIKKVRPANILVKIFVENCSRGNYFATIKISAKKYFGRHL
jgi:hypothetical protein